MSERTAEQDALPIVHEKRRVLVVGDDVVRVPSIDVPLSVPSPPTPPGYRRLLLVGEFYEIHGVCYEVRKITKHDYLLRRFTGTLVVGTKDASPLQLKGARRAD